MSCDQRLTYTVIEISRSFTVDCALKVQYNKKVKDPSSTTITCACFNKSFLVQKSSSETHVIE